MSRSGKLWVLLLFWIFGFGWPSCALALNQILNIRHWVAPDHTRVVIDVSEDVAYSIEKSEKSIAIDLAETTLPAHLPHSTVLKKPGLEGVSISSRPNSAVRVEISFPGMVQTTVFKLNPFQDKPFRVVVDLVLPDAAKQESQAREQIKVTRKARVVVIDPGHGGDDPGAVGKGRTLEKTVVLGIARELRKILNRQEGYRAFLTRNGDYYVSFRKRIMIAREYGADLFLSIHADATRSRTVRGSSVYCLSTGAASSEAAKILARNENLADVIGGVPNGEGSDAADPIILDMFQTHTINQAKNFGATVLKELDAANGLKFTTVQEAPFFVLKLPEIPSILVETAYISNPKEEKLLRSRRFQKRIAEGVARAVFEFLPPLPPEKVTVTQGKDVKPVSAEGSDGEGKDEIRTAAMNVQRPVNPAAAVYRVKRGDTLSAIAARHGITLTALAERNRIKVKDPLFVGRRLVIPMSDVESKRTTEPEASTRAEGETHGKAASEASTLDRSAKADPGGTLPLRTVCRVKRGDTLSAIAARHGITVAALAERNRIKVKDPLFVGRKLVIPASVQGTKNAE